MIEGVKINLFGEFRVWRDGQPIEGNEWDRQKTRSLLKLLLTRQGHVFSRDEIMEVLWPDPDASPTSAKPPGYHQLATSGAQKLASTPAIPPPEMRTFIYDLLSERIDSSATSSGHNCHTLGRKATSRRDSANSRRAASVPRSG